jgi:thiol-disulfide isomerase/thioredoxin
MTRISALTSLVAGAALTLSFGCTPGPSGGGGGDEEIDDPGPVSSYAQNGYPKIAEDWEDYLGDGSERRDTMHTFEMVDQNGNLVDFRQFLGFVVILDLSAEWCPPCRAAAETAQEVSDEMQDLGAAYYVQIISQNMVADPATEQTVIDWSTDFDLDLPVLADEGEAFSQLVGINAYPTFWVIRPDGTIDRRQSGVLSDSRIVAWVDYLLEDEEANLRDIPGWPDPDAEFED